jgi:carbamoyl-phosphate synthase large subunit
MSINSPALYFGDEYKIFPSNNDKNFLSLVVQYCKENSISLILPTSDRDMSLLIEERSFLLQSGIKVLMSDSSTIKMCLSNFSFIKTCIDYDLPIPKSYSSISDIEYPCVGKLDLSQGSKGVFLIKNVDDLSELLAKYDFSELMFQRYINSTEYSIDAFYGEKGELVSAIARERVEVVNGESTVTMTYNIPKLVLLAEKLSTIFNFWGHVTIQAFYDGDEVSLIEINPRFGGASSLSIEAGLETPKWTLDLIDNPNLSPAVSELKYGLKMLRYPEDLFL